MSNFLNNDSAAKYIRDFMPLVAAQTNIERSYAEYSFVQGMIVFASAAQLIELETWKALEGELKEIYKQQVDKFKVLI